MILKNKYKARRLLLKIIIISAISFNITAETVNQKPPQRTALSFENLTDTSTKYTNHNSSPVNNDNYLPNSYSKAAKHDFSGTISISETEMLSIPEKILPTIVNNKYTQLFPGLNLALFSGQSLVTTVIPEHHSHLFSLVILKTNPTTASLVSFIQIKKYLNYTIKLFTS